MNQSQTTDQSVQISVTIIHYPITDTTIYKNVLSGSLNIEWVFGVFFGFIFSSYLFKN